MEYFVNGDNKIGGDGSKDRPFCRISDAAAIAKAGDVVTVYPGIYREQVNPINAGTKDARIVYRSSEIGKAIITGAEVVDNWTKYEGDVWAARIDNKIFNNYNPYTTRVEGDWFIATIVAHTGDVYLNHKSMYEATTLEEVLNPTIFYGSWDRDFTLYKWYTCQDEANNQTVIYANFQGLNPNEEEVEISVRQNCFMPKEEGVGYITLSGFVVREAATQWAPPTAYQDGMIGPHWSKGWIIEDCEIYESKCSGISLGKYLQPENDNKWLKWNYKDGTQNERDVICMASYNGWDKEHIGSHIVRRCQIHDCGQTGIVGHLGGVFSIIEENHIYNINNKQNLAGAEIGGIKMHAAIDVIYRKNIIHHCTRGLWLDWQAQGTRVTENIFYDNALPFDLDQIPKEHVREACMGMGEDIFVEVSHGPTLIDGNLLLSKRSLKLASQGIACVHNVIAGSLVSIGIGTDNGTINVPSPRYTPYHEPHGTAVRGFMTFLHGDCRFYNNIFIQQKVHPVFVKMQEDYKANPDQLWDDNNFEVGTFRYDSYPTYEEWNKMFDGYCGMGSPASDRYYSALPVWSKDNVYINGAKPWKNEPNPQILDLGEKLYFEIQEVDDSFTFSTNLYDFVSDKGSVITTDDLGFAFEPEQRFENPDGSKIVINV